MSDCELENLRRQAVLAADMKWPQDAPHTFEQVMAKTALVVKAWKRWYDSLPDGVKQLIDDLSEG